LIDTHSGKWTWYQLARSDAGINLAVNGKNWMQVIRNLTDWRYVEKTDGPNPSQPYYSITQLGREALANEEK
jgi:hypothetical protein